MGHTKALLLINDKKSQVLVAHILGEHPMSPDDHVHLALFKPLYGLVVLLCRPKARQHLHLHGIILHPLGKSGIVLLGQNGGGAQIHHLLAFLHGLEGCPKGDLRLAVAHIPTDEPIHDLVRLHVMLHILDGRILTLGLLVWEGLLKLPLPYGILPIYIALGLLPQCIQIHQLLCHYAHGRLDL